MIDMVGELLKRLTPARAALLDNVDANVSGIPLASDFTAARAADIDAAISSRLSTAINSIQYGSITLTAAGGVGGARTFTATITSVNTAKSIVIYLGLETSGSSGFFPVRIELTNATTVTAYQDSSFTNQIIVGFVVVEFK